MSRQQEGEAEIYFEFVFLVISFGEYMKRSFSELARLIG